MKFYICGPMSGLPEFNYPAFNAAAASLRQRYGHVIEFVNPVELDDAEQLDPSTTANYSKTYFDVLARDLRRIMDVDGLVVLPGWENSRGARAEVALAKSLSKHLFSYRDDADPEPFVGLSDEMATVSVDPGSAVRGRVGAGLFDETTDYSTPAKGQKIARFDLIPPEALSEVAVLYGRGEAKYPRVGGVASWLQRPYAFSVSFAAMMRHAFRWWRGEDFDAENGCHHLAAVVFHCNTIMTFQNRGLGTDDRPMS